MVRTPAVHRLPRALPYLRIRSRRVDSEDLAPAPRGSKAVSLERATLVCYEWGANEAEPAKPVLGLARQEGGRPQILVRSNDLFTIGRLPAALGTSHSFSQTRNARFLFSIRSGVRLRMQSSRYRRSRSSMTSSSRQDPRRRKRAARGRPAHHLPRTSPRSVCLRNPPHLCRTYVEEGALKNHGTPARPTQPSAAGGDDLMCALRVTC